MKPKRVYQISKSASLNLMYKNLIVKNVKYFVEEGIHKIYINFNKGYMTITAPERILGERTFVKPRKLKYI